MALIAHREWRRVAPAPPPRARSRVLRQTVGLVLTFWFVCAAWILFRATSISDSWTVLRAYAFFHSPGDAAFGRTLLWVLPAFLLAHLIARRWPPGRCWRRAPTWVYASGLAVAWAVVLAFVPIDFQPFIYFQF